MAENSIPESRKELYELAWSQPIDQFAREYGLSRRGFALACRRLRVPVPPRGYWAKKKAGQDPPRIPFTPFVEAVIAQAKASRTREPTEKKPPAQIRKSRPNGQHPLLAGVREHFENSRHSSGDYLRPKKKLVVDLFVSKSGLEAALATANNLFQGLEEQGHAVVIAPHGINWQRPEVNHRRKRRGNPSYDEIWSPLRPTVVCVEDLFFGLTLFELSDLVEVVHVDGEYIRAEEYQPPKRKPWSYRDPWKTTRDLPSGCFCLRAFSPYPGVSWEREWQEEKPGAFLGRAEEIGKVLERQVPHLRRLMAEAKAREEQHRKEREEQTRKWEREAAIQRRNEAWRKSRKELLELITAWDLARRIEGFFLDLEGQVGGLEGEEQTRVRRRLQQARAMFGGTESLAHFEEWSSPAELLGTEMDKYEGE